MNVIATNVGSIPNDLHFRVSLRKIFHNTTPNVLKTGLKVNIIYHSLINENRNRNHRVNTLIIINNNKRLIIMFIINVFELCNILVIAICLLFVRLVRLAVTLTIKLSDVPRLSKYIINSFRNIFLNSVIKHCVFHRILETLCVVAELNATLTWRQNNYIPLIFSFKCRLKLKIKLN